jgi:hypothetical protein
MQVMSCVDNVANGILLPINTSFVIDKGIGCFWVIPPSQWWEMAQQPVRTYRIIQQIDYRWANLNVEAQKIWKSEGIWHLKKANNRRTKDLNGSEGDEISNYEHKRMMLRMIETEDMYKQLNDIKENMNKQVN